jgi:hypothetical protein
MSWRVVAVGLVALALFAAVAAAVTTPLIVWPPVLAAAGVLIAAALASDYFGFSRRRHGWDGIATDPRQALARARILGRRFAREKSRGSIRAPRTARALLLSLAEGDRLRDAGDVVDFLGADAMCNAVGTDVVADALRAVALAELGRGAEANELAGELAGRWASLPVVAYARGRVAETRHDVRQALVHVDAALVLPQGRRSRELLVLRARLLAKLGRTPETEEALRTLLTAGYRTDVESLAERGAPALALAARTALGTGALYR